jgi:uncharacterized protein (DUF111 family)
MAPLRTGFGAGTSELPEQPNVLRAVLGDEISGEPATYVVVETNVDDMTGELAAHTMTELLAAGARDAWTTAVTMKHGRPGLTLAALCREVDATAIASVLMRESTTIGVRCTPAHRIERPRRIVTVATRFGDVSLKVSEGNFGPAQIKPEFAQCQLLARQHHTPVRTVIAEALAAYSRSLDR